jgi:hypothetical protein
MPGNSSFLLAHANAYTYPNADISNANTYHNTYSRVCASYGRSSLSPERWLQLRVYGYEQ